MFSVFTQRMTFCLMMLILHPKHFTLPKKKKKTKVNACQVDNYEREINSCKSEFELSRRQVFKKQFDRD